MSRWCCHGNGVTIWIRVDKYLFELADLVKLRYGRFGGMGSTSKCGTAEHNSLGCNPARFYFYAEQNYELGYKKIIET